jgi:uncharacterized cupredoxin-like copper-binding protein
VTIHGVVAASLTVAVLSLAAGCGSAGDVKGSGVVRFQDSHQATGPRTVHVGLIEWTITLSRVQVRQGRIHLVVTNAGSTTHDLDVSGSLGEWDTGDLQPGEQRRLTIRAEAGETLGLVCDEPGHSAAGMHTSLDVAGAP